jgi:starch-binding outer membrane protein, SusD/RagB family
MKKPIKPIKTIPSFFKGFLSNHFHSKNTMKLKHHFSTILKGFLPLLIIAGIGFSGCDILDVDNPNSLIEEDLENPAAAPAIANGAEATLTRALGSLLAPYSTVTDELTWIGTRDAWLQLNQGYTLDPLNEFADNAYSSLNEARWTADNAIQILEGFHEDGSLQSNTPLVRSYFYGAVVYLSVADAFDNFVISDRQEAGHPIGRDNLHALIDTAIEYLNAGIELAGSGTDWETRLLAVRARAHFSSALWSKLKPDVDLQNPLVASSSAVADAQDVLSRIGYQNDWRYELIVSSETTGNSLAFQVNERLELRIGNAFVQPTSDNTRADFVTLQDPIDEIPAPYLVDEIDAFVAANQYANITLISARELHLIIAENEAASNNTAGFSEAVNRLRSLDGLSEYSGQISETDLIEHSRKVNLFLQGRRLADLYRFGKTSPQWSSNRVTTGAFFPITNSEITSNPNVNFGD